MGFKISGYEVLKKIKEGAWQHYIFVKHIRLTKNENIITILLQDWQGNPLPYEPVNVSITGKDIDNNDLEPFNDVCDDGTIELDNYMAGDTLTITATADYMESATLEVTV